MKNIKKSDNGVNERPSLIGRSVAPGKASAGYQAEIDRYATTGNKNLSKPSVSANPFTNENNEGGRNRIKWSVSMKREVIDCFFKSRTDGQPIRRYRKGLHAEYKKKNCFDFSERRLCD